jgi:hypothetical protein
MFMTSDHDPRYGYFYPIKCDNVIGRGSFGIHPSGGDGTTPLGCIGLEPPLSGIPTRQTGSRRRYLRNLASSPFACSLLGFNSTDRAYAIRASWISFVAS